MNEQKEQRTADQKLAPPDIVDQMMWLTLTASMIEEGDYIQIKLDTFAKHASALAKLLVELRDSRQQASLHADQCATFEARIVELERENAEQYQSYSREVDRLAAKCNDLTEKLGAAERRSHETDVAQRDTQADLILGRIAFKYIDRMNDLTSEDHAEKVVDEFTHEAGIALAKQWKFGHASLPNCYAPGCSKPRAKPFVYCDEHRESTDKGAATPTQPLVKTFQRVGPEKGMSAMCECGATMAHHIAQDHLGNACVCPKQPLNTLGAQK